MRAAVVPSLGAPLQILDRPVPEPGPGQIRVRIEASGLCHTDVHAARGDWPVQPAAPFVPGHEGVGVVDAAGPGVVSPVVGTRVALPWLGHACGRCRYCVTGWETLCAEQQRTGYSIDGGFAEYSIADAAFAVEVPGGVDPVDAAPLTCAGVTTYKAVKVAGITPTQLVSVVGIGGLGHLAVQYARLVGGIVVAVDVRKDKLDLATELGATHVVNAVDIHPEDAVRDLGGADVAIVLAATNSAVESAFASLRPGGRLVLVSLPRNGTLSLPIFDTVLNGKQVIGSIVGTRQDLREVFALHAAGRTQVITEVRPLDGVNEAMRDLLAGDVPARIVFRP
jgi:propanol-preferring alcohol dehydrogenase